MNEKKVTVITIVCLVLILLAGGGAIYYLEFDVLAAKQVELDGLKAQVADAKKKQAEIKIIEANIKRIQEALQVESKKIPDLDREEYDKLANMLDDFRRRAGVTVDRASWNTPKPPFAIASRPTRLTSIPPNVHKVEYDLTVSGTFYQLLRYINLLEQQTRFMNVESFTITPGAASPTPVVAGAAAAAVRQPPPQRNLKVTIYTYTYKPQPKPFEIEAVAEIPSQSTPVPD